MRSEKFVQMRAFLWWGRFHKIRIWEQQIGILFDLITNVLLQKLFWFGNPHFYSYNSNLQTSKSNGIQKHILSKSQSLGMQIVLNTLKPNLPIHHICINKSYWWTKYGLILHSFLMHIRFWTKKEIEKASHKLKNIQRKF